MATIKSSNVLQQLKWVAFSQDSGGQTDGQLLECFLTRQDEAAFAVLVRRHGPMVLGVCRRILGNVHDAEDAFQAAFLVLARKGDSVRPRDMVGNWLYGVAYRTALAARAAIARRVTREKQVPTMPEPATVEPERWLELQPLLDQELQRLPDKYRVAVVLCELEGRSRKEAAQQLGVPEGTLSSRLAMARQLLAGRLARRGLVLSLGTLSVLLVQQGASAGVSASLVASTVKAAGLFAAGEAATASLASAEAVALAKGVMTGMFLSKLKIATAVFLALSLLGTGVGGLTHQVLAGDRQAPAEERAEEAIAAPTEVVAAADEPAREGDKPREGVKPRDGDKPGAKGGKGEMVTLTGTVSKEEAKRKRDDGSELAVTNYYLTEAKGNKVLLPAPRVSEGGKVLDTYKLADFVGKQVAVTARALTVRASERTDAPLRVTRVLAITDIKEKK